LANCADDLAPMEDNEAKLMNVKSFNSVSTNAGGNRRERPAGSKINQLKKKIELLSKKSTGNSNEENPFKRSSASRSQSRERKTRE